MSSHRKPWVAITGSSSGIGKVAALHLAREGFGVVLASEQAAALRQVQSEIVDSGGRAEVVDLNLLDATSVAQFIPTVNDKVGFCDFGAERLGEAVGRPLGGAISRHPL